MEESLIVRWNEQCECKNCNDFKDCKCGAASRLELVCKVCAKGLEIRPKPDGTGDCFWACSGYFTDGCQYTRSCEVVAAQSRAAVDQPTWKRPKLGTVTPESRQQPEAPPASSSARRQLAFVQPPLPIKLADTFIGEELALDLQANHSFQPTAFQNAASCVKDPNQLIYTEGKSYGPEVFCYSYPTDKTNHKIQIQGAPTVGEYFAGAGGMSLGLKQAGFTGKFAVENNKAACDTLRSNFKGTAVIEQDVWSFRDAMKQNRPSFTKNTNHRHFSPPCQAVTEAKINTPPTDKDIETNELMRLVPELLSLEEPDTASLETVPGILDDSNKHYLQEIVAGALKCGYQVRGVLLNAADYGDPQERRRVFLFMAKKGLYLAEVPVKSKSKTTIKDCLGPLEKHPPVSPGVPVIIEDGKPAVYDHHLEDLSTVGPNIDLKASERCLTVRRRTPIYHYIGPRASILDSGRRVTVRERALIQSFPLYYHFCGTLDQQLDQIGNAVPVNLAEAVGRSIMKANICSEN